MSFHFEMPIDSLLLFECAWDLFFVVVVECFVWDLVWFGRFRVMPNPKGPTPSDPSKLNSFSKFLWIVEGEVRWPTVLRHLTWPFQACFFLLDVDVPPLLSVDVISFLCFFYLFLWVFCFQGVLFFAPWKQVLVLIYGFPSWVCVCVCVCVWGGGGVCERTSALCGRCCCCFLLFFPLFLFLLALVVLAVVCVVRLLSGYCVESRVSPSLSVFSLF